MRRQTAGGCGSHDKGFKMVTIKLKVMAILSVAVRMQREKQGQGGGYETTTNCRLKGF
jgi:hypothetical protein